MDRRVSALQVQNPLFQPPEHSGNGFLRLDDPPNGWGDPSIHPHSVIFNLCYPFLAPHASSFLFHSFSYARTAGVNPSLIDQGTRSPSYDYLSSTQSIPTMTAISVLDSLYSFDPSSHALVYKPEGSHDSTHHGLAYKPVAKQVVAVPAPLAEPLPTKPPDFIPGVRFTAERAEALDLDPANWLWPEELKLI
ncbi:hypothetical protein PAXINDRAFT_9324 [Paxillus involutus ATCC 200175]|nr:hypothetical protein PAXINDRAFT_9324 [Paxillus involutus ATCC 200175]